MPEIVFQRKIVANGIEIDPKKLDAKLIKFVDCTQFLIAKELLRRGVRIWEF